MTKIGVSYKSHNSIPFGNLEVGDMFTLQPPSSVPSEIFIVIPESSEEDTPKNNALCITDQHLNSFDDDHNVYIIQRMNITIIG